MQLTKTTFDKDIYEIIRNLLNYCITKADPRYRQIGELLLWKNKDDWSDIFSHYKEGYAWIIPRDDTEIEEILAIATLWQPNHREQMNHPGTFKTHGFRIPRIQITSETKQVLFDIPSMFTRRTKKGPKRIQLKTIIEYSSRHPSKSSSRHPSKSSSRHPSKSSSRLPIIPTPKPRRTSRKGKKQSSSQRITRSMKKQTRYKTYYG